ncbi:MAG: Glu-tRNA(Gln) amidotransferase subunit GatE [Candidatus Methanomethyliaceae archaeon]|nr:Glu-tRNA(Gln) amidotransferase subunit GatE [Candidatus Methanomethyliaceae archaeon]MDW7971282.1 Glu-tRNA(Gln) amidotransferase subunit GatE [Nitrososphaerota archaeon]
MRVGIEIHQQLDTKNKLFCNCSTILREDPPHFIVIRKLRPVTSELGEVDQAALFESEKQKIFQYQGYVDSTCLVELDEEPPHEINKDAVMISLTVAKMLNMIIVDEIHVMRKIVIDGSNTTGFQRTAKIALDGWIDDEEGRVSIKSLCLEEDSARKISEGPDYVVYRLDRLGIPLIEISTGPDIRSGDQARRVALKLGRILKATGMVKRGLGTIRQDLNISIEGGARVEIKGVQELGLISTVVNYEALRQKNLIEIAEELRRRNAYASEELFDVTEIFSLTTSKIIKKELIAGGKVFAIILHGFADILRKDIQPGRRFGTELSDYAKVYGGIGGIFHTDELPAYGISEDEVRALRNKLNANSMDCIVIAAGEPQSCKRALLAVVRRANQALLGVPAEVRAANPDGTTHFMRPMPGAARMYPETDIPSMVITEDILNKIKLPELLELKIKRFIEGYGLSPDLASLIIESPYSSTFEELVNNYKIDPSFVASTFEYTFRMLRREGVDVDSFDKNQILELFLRINKGDFAKEALPNILRWLSNNKGKSIEDAINALSLTRVDISIIRDSARKIVEENMELIKREGEHSLKKLMGDLMKLYRGKIDGKIIYEILREEILKKLA